MHFTFEFAILYSREPVNTFDPHIRTTTRSAEFYRKVFFPECSNVREAIDELLSCPGLKLDAGAGMNAKNPYSFLNAYYRRRKERNIDAPADFYGVEPKEKTPKNPHGCFHARHDMTLIEYYVCKSIGRVLTGHMPHIRRPGRNNVFALTLENTQHISGIQEKVSHIFSSYLFPWHIMELDFLKSAHFMLQPGEGTLDMHPVNDWHLDKLTDPETETGVFVNEHFDVETWHPYPWLEKIERYFGYTARFTKKEAA